MCGRFTLRTPQAKLVEQFGLEIDGALVPRYNISPTQRVLVMRQSDEGSRNLAPVQWGFVPHWAADCKSGFINARSETVATKPAYKHAFKSRRCLILADGFFEWQKVASGKQPWYFTLKDDRPFAFAGIWSTWHKGAEPLDTCAIITTSANSVLEPYHDRMPVILRESDLATWLDPHIEQEQRLLDLLAPLDPAEMSARRVSRLVNSPKNSSPDCIAEERELFA